MSTFFNTSKPEEALPNLDAHLLFNSYIVGSHVTAADILFYSLLHPVVVRLSDQDRTARGNVIRWFDHVQYQPVLSSLKGRFSVVSIPLAPSKLFSYVPPKASASSAASSGAENKSKPAPAAAAGESKRKPAAAAKSEDKSSGAAAAATATTAAESKSDGEAKTTQKAEKGKGKQEGKAAQEKGKQAAGGEKQQKQDKGKDKGGNKGSAAPAETKSAVPATSDGKVGPVYRLDLRVAKVVSDASKHPTKDNLYVYQADIGSGKPVPVVSSLADVLPMSDLKGKMVALIVNQKEGSVDGVATCGARVLYATLAGKKELVEAPADAKVGEKIQFKGAEGEPDAVVNNKHFTSIQKDFKTADNSRVQHSGIDAMTSAGPLTVKSLKGASVAF